MVRVRNLVRISARVNVPSQLYKLLPLVHRPDEVLTKATAQPQGHTLEKSVWNVYVCVVCVWAGRTLAPQSGRRGK